MDPHPVRFGKALGPEVGQPHATTKPQIITLAKAIQQGILLLRPVPCPVRFRWSRNRKQKPIVLVSSEGEGVRLAKVRGVGGLFEG